MKILIIGSDETWSIERIYLKYLKELNVTVDLFPAQSLFYQYYGRSLLNKVFFRAGLSAITRKINEAAKKKIEAFGPVIIWVFKGMEVSPPLLKWIQKKGIKLVNYNPDNPFIFSGRGSGNKNITKCIPFYDLHFTYNLAIEEKLKKSWKVKTAFLPFGFDVSDELYHKCIIEPEIIKVCFLGNPDTKRASFLNKLASEGIAIDVFGNNWGSFVSHENIQSYPPVYGDQLWKVLRRYRVQINLMRIHNENSHNMRTFEVPGIGGIMVAPDTREHRLFFENGKEVFLFTDVKHCAGIIHEILLLDFAKASSIRNNAREKSINAGYTYKDRTGFAIEVMNEL